MEDRRYRITNKTLEKVVGAGVQPVNSAREPLMALRVMVEGLGAGEERGLWLTQVTVLPMVPRLSPFDLVYLDSGHRVVERAELLPTSEIPRFKKPATSALVLPFRTISSMQIEVGHEFALDEVLDSDSVAEPVPVEPAPTKIADIDKAPARPAPAPEPIAELESPFLHSLLSELPKGEAAPLSSPIERPEPRKNGNEFVLSDFLRAHPADPPATLQEQTPDREPVVQQVPAVPSLRTKPRVKKAARRQKTVQQVVPKPEEVNAAAGAKKPGVDRFFRWLYPALYDQNRRSADRVSSQGLVAYELAGDAPRMHEVGDISSQGLYLRTQERWEPGAVIALTLQPSPESQERVEFDCAVVRTGADGVGMSILMPAGTELRLWEAPGRNGENTSDPYCIARELRMARALAFLRRVCPPADEQITELLHKTLSNVRAANIVEVALRAERLTAEETDAECLVAHSELILKILEHGSWVDVDWLQDLWAGLLATSCTFEGQDESNRVYINLLSKLSPLPTQILTVACAKAMQGMTESAAMTPARLACSAEEIARITRSNNLLKIYKSIGELSELGLVEKNPRSASPENPEAAKAVPTQLGLEMFARCNGQRNVSMAA